MLNIYIVIIGSWGVLIHANVRPPWGPLRRVLVTPDFHHWHHSSDDEVDKNRREIRPAIPAELWCRRQLHAGGFRPSAAVPFQRLLAARAKSLTGRP